MRLAAGLLVLLCVAGCGGTMIYEKRADGSSAMPAVSAKVRCCDISQREAAEIASSEASARECGHLRVQDVKGDANRYHVTLTGHCGAREAKIRVKVDRHTGQVVSYKSKLEKRDCQAH